MESNIHDALFKDTFSRVEHAAGELRHVLPPELVARIDFGTLALCPGSFVDEAFAQRHTDLLFSAQVAGRAAFIYVLLEHQSSVDPLMPYRILCYLVRIWEAYLGKNPTRSACPPSSRWSSTTASAGGPGASRSRS